MSETRPMHEFGLENSGPVIEDNQPNNRRSWKTIIAASIIVPVGLSFVLSKESEGNSTERVDIKDPTDQTTDTSTPPTTAVEGNPNFDGYFEHEFSSGHVINCAVLKHTIEPGDRIYDLTVSSEEDGTFYGNFKFDAARILNTQRGLDPDNIDIGDSAYLLQDCVQTSPLYLSYDGEDTFYKVHDFERGTSVYYDGETNEATSCYPDETCVEYLPELYTGE